jgi:hypothetical protein
MLKTNRIRVLLLNISGDCDRHSSTTKTWPILDTVQDYFLSWLGESVQYIYIHIYISIYLSIHPSNMHIYIYA